MFNFGFIVFNLACKLLAFIFCCLSIFCKANLTFGDSLIVIWFAPGNPPGVSLAPFFVYCCLLLSFPG